MNIISTTNEMLEFLMNELLKVLKNPNSYKDITVIDTVYVDEMGTLCRNIAEHGKQDGVVVFVGMLTSTGIRKETMFVHLTDDAMKEIYKVQKQAEKIRELQLLVDE